MFSSPTFRGRRGTGEGGGGGGSAAKTGGEKVTTPRRDTSTIDDPIEEFNYLLDRLGCLMEISKDAYYYDGDDIPEKPTSAIGFFRQNRKARKDGNDSTPNSRKSSPEPRAATPLRARSNDGDIAASPKSPSTPPPSQLRRNNSTTKLRDAVFLSIAEEDECVEIIRRLAELVIIGERVVATQMDKEDKIRQHQQKKGWGGDILEEEDEPAERELEPGSEAYIGIFDLFFERNGLGMLVDILTGQVFSAPLKLREEASKKAATAAAATASSENPNSGEVSEIKESDDNDNQESSADQPTATEATEIEKVSDAEDQPPTPTARFVEETLLPSLKVATQAVQSVSILVQNVSRATSLYFVLSNNYINALIDLPLDLYSAAERKKLASMGKNPLRVKTFSTPELQELTTHFVTFLKSLAMRMNTETLQFYLKYPTVVLEGGENSTTPDEETRARAIEFPLYARALDFCAAHHDSFVRVTAMNICLNTLRLCTVCPSSENENNNPSSKRDLGSSPDGVLHNASPLPFRERLAIATHTCAPSRVGRLASPIFTKLSNLWCVLQEKFLELDTPLQVQDNSEEGGTGIMDRSMGAKRDPMDLLKEREKRHNNFRDAAATIQDQLLLLDDLLKVGLTALNEQIIEMMLATFVYPLLLQPLLVYYQRLPSDSGEAPPMQDPFANRTATVDFNQVGRAPPEVTAPAKTALFTLASVFHLISNRPLIRLLYTALFHPLSPNASGETVISAEGCVTSVDSSTGKRSIRIDEPAYKDSDERSSYPFGGVEQVASSANINIDQESCVFVLSPALADVLKCGGSQDCQTLLSGSNTRPNPYRRAILQCLEVPHHMSDFRKLAFNTVDAAISFFDGEFLVDSLLGKELAKVGSSEADQTRYRTEVVSALCEGLVNGKPGPFGTWKLQFDAVAAHALLCVTWRSPESLEMAAKIVEERYWKAAILLSEVPARIPTTLHLGAVMNLIFLEAANKRRKATFSDLYYMKNTAPERFSTAIASSSSFRSLCTRSFEAPPTPVLLNKFNEHTAMDLGSSSCRAMLKLDALLTFLKAVSKDHGSVLSGVQPFGFALTSDRGLVDTKECFIDDLTRSIHCYLSPEFCAALTDADTGGTSGRPMPGTVVALAGRTAMPCVCEAPPNSGTTDNGAKMVVEGITWQSLYLVFFGSYLVLAEPAPGSAGSGRVVTSCPLSRITVAKDPNPPADPNSPARRLLMAYKWFDTNAPTLFVYDEPPREEEYGPFHKVKLWRSKLDVWFEDEGAAAHAYHSIHFQIDKAKTLRGDRILDYLTQHQDDN